MARLRLSLARLLGWLFSRENLTAIVLFLILAALVIFTADSSPLWIYQGF